jgi:uncharacterized membrane protein YoaK (UPF0700 family)
MVNADRATHYRTMAMAANDPKPSMADVLTAGIFAFLAGATDVYGVSILRDIFVSFMSGNTTMLGIALGNGDWARAGLIAECVGLFVVGSAAGAIIDLRVHRWQKPVVAVTVAVMLTLPCLRPAWAAAAYVLAMGALNAAMNRVGGAAIGLTYVTGTLVKLGQGLGQALCGHPEGWRWLVHLPMWLSLLAGAVAAVAVRTHSVGDALWPLPLLAWAVALGVATLEASRCWRTTTRRRDGG